MTENKRVIKFRAWDTITKQMAPDYAFGPNSWDGGLAVERFNFGIMIGVRLELMQFTGLVDKNGKEIYEGDICKLNGGAQDVFFEVDFEDGCFVARVPWKMEGSPELKAYTFFKPEVMTVEVVGNIHENENLVEHGK